MGDKFLVADHSLNINDKTPLLDTRSFLKKNLNQIIAFIMGGTRVCIDRVHKLFWEQVNEALNMGVINNEQNLLHLMILRQPDLYHVWYKTKYQYPRLSGPLVDRMAPVELARWTFFGENYPINENIKLLTIATKNVGPDAYRKWETTAKHFGYNYELLGRDENWGGWSTKTRLFYERLKTVTQPYTALTDCTDLFICGSSSELYDTFISLNTDLIIGGELKLWYHQGKYKRDTIEEYFKSIRKSPQAFPNAGFVMGKTEKLLHLMELHLDYKDDQAASIDTIYENKNPLSIDYHTSVIGNVPNYHTSNHESIGYFEFDPIFKRYKNKISSQLPIFIHFPGRNKACMEDFYLTFQQDNFIDSQQSTSTPISVPITIIVIMVILIIVLYIMITFNY